MSFSGRSYQQPQKLPFEGRSAVTGRFVPKKEAEKKLTSLLLRRLKWSYQTPQITSSTYLIKLQRGNSRMQPRMPLLLLLSILISLPPPHLIHWRRIIHIHLVLLNPLFQSYRMQLPLILHRNMPSIVYRNRLIRNG